MAESIEGEPLSPGVVTGCLVLCSAGARPVRTASVGGANQEVERFHARIGRLVDRIERDIQRLHREDLTAEAGILETHVFLLRDRKFHEKVEDLIRRNEIAAEAAVDLVLGGMIEQLERSDNPVLSGRGADIRDIIAGLREQVSEEESAVFESLREMENPVLATRELLPSLVLKGKEGGLGGFVVEEGTPLSHAVILAKAFGIPVLRIDSLARLKDADHRRVLVDALKGRMVIEPTPEQEAASEAVQATQYETPVGHSPVRLWANIVDPSQVTENLASVVAGVGLYRTEMLFMQARRGFPDEQQQFEVYRRLFEQSGQMPVTFRTLDIGGDKNLSYFSLGPQGNPYLGLRAHRIYRYHPEILITQVRAVLRAAGGAADLRILYPMIETPDELLFVRGLLGQAVESLEAEGREYQHRFQEGIMIEVPSAAWDIEALLELVDFASVGTNDLLQYFFATDRGNANARAGYQPMHPAALRMLAGLVEAAAKAGKPLSLCGELASDPRFLPLLVGLGFRDLSVDVRAIAGTARRLADLDVPSCERLAQRCLRARTTAEVQEILQIFDPARSVAQAEAGGAYVDPICGMVVDAKRAAFVVSYDSQKVYFCSSRCREEYLNKEKLHQGTT